ncbi:MULTISPECIES: YdcH family protein [Sulfurimonas]|uniref:DUF465 domain-containing protein n=1 Tax=Sulfurimonas diazotrophicus TaxID=3131939 RepID=A0ABZ3H8Y0_9BACT
MLHEYREIITKMKEDGSANAHFLKIFERHNELDDLIEKGESGQIPMDDVEIEKLKKEKLLLKDEAYAEIIKYKKENDL